MCREVLVSTVAINHLDFFAKFIETRLGIVYAPENYFRLETRLNDILLYFKLGNLEELKRNLESGKALMMEQLLLDSATNNETSFFRDQKVFDAIREFVISEVGYSPTGRPLRIWSAASSTGQEAYSLAMTLHEKLTTSLTPRANIDILATDISQRVLDRVREGIYSQLEVQRGLRSEMLLKYFHQVNASSWEIKSFIKNYVRTAQVNLCLPFEHVGKFDIILCRNVLIYQRAEKKVEIINRLVERLNPGGFLMLGAGETLLGLSDKFIQQNYKNAIIYQLPKLESPAKIAMRAESVALFGRN